LAAALANETLPPSDNLVKHLDQCLSCMSCEVVCPSDVQYSGLIVQTRSLLQRQYRQARPWRWLKTAITNPRRLRLMVRLARALNLKRFADSRVGKKLFTRLGLEVLVRELPSMPVPRRWPERTVPNTKPRGKVGLFLGCVASVFDQDVHAAAIELLSALGYEVVIPADQGCCGALALHAGELDSAKTTAVATRAAFLSSGIDTVLVSASGCFGALRDSVFAQSGVNVIEIHRFLADHPQWSQLRWRALKQTVTVHTPCTQMNVARGDEAIFSLLNRIPQLRILPLALQPRCCGAAGSYFLEHPQIADALRSEKLDQALEAAPDMLLTSNIGCRIYLTNGLRQRNAALPVLHPLVLLAQQLDRPNSSLALGNVEG
jgi:glycolate oxidase iron-sulfur subunit